MTIEVNPDTPRSTITIAGLQFKVPEPFKEGHVLDANEAATLNQTYAENVRNNMAKRVSDAKETAEKEGKELDLGALQFAVDEYVSDYQFGVRRGGASADPVEREAMNIARELVKTKIREKGGKLSDYKAADISAKAEQLLEKYPQITEQAKRTVDAQRQAAEAFAGDLANVEV